MEPRTKLNTFSFESYNVTHVTESYNVTHVTESYNITNVDNNEYEVLASALANPLQGTRP